MIRLANGTLLVVVGDEPREVGRVRELLVEVAGAQAIAAATRAEVVISLDPSGPAGADLRKLIQSVEAACEPIAPRPSRPYTGSGRIGGNKSDRKRDRGARWR